MKTAKDVLEHLAKDASEAGVTKVCVEIADWAKAGHTKELASLARGLELAATSAQADAYEKVVDLVEDQLALTSTDEAIDAILALSQEPRAKSVVTPRTNHVRQCAIASRLGYAQEKKAFVSALARHGDKYRDLFACWMHELVLRRVSLANEPAAKKLADELVQAGHPLGGLPLDVRPLEREAPSYMPLYGDRGLTSVLEALTDGPMSARTMPPPAEGKDVATTERAPNPLLSRAVKPWQDGKRGKVEMKAFELSVPLAPNLLGSWLLRSLPLDSTKGVPREGLDCQRVQSEAVFGPLFAAAANGGAYSPGLGGAYGRREAWTSLGALVGAPDGSSVADIEKAAQKTVFISFSAEGPWFYDVAWDLGVLALQADQKNVIVLAATDSE